MDVRAIPFGINKHAYKPIYKHAKHPKFDWWTICFQLSKACLKFACSYLSLTFIFFFYLSISIASAKLDSSYFHGTRLACEYEKFVKPPVEGEIKWKNQMNCNKFTESTKLSFRNRTNVFLVNLNVIFITLL